MAPIIPSGGKKMDWVKDPDQPVNKTAQGMFDDDPQLDAIKGLPGMQDGIDELNEMATEDSSLPSVCEECPKLDTDSVADDEGVAGTAGGAVEQAIEEVKDAAQGVADAAVKDVEKAVTDAVKNVNVGPVESVEPVEPVADTLDEIKPEGGEGGEGVTEEGEEVTIDIPGVEGDTDGIEKGGDDDAKDKDKDEDKDEDSKPAFAAARGMRRLAELSADETKDLRHYWKDLLGFPPEYVDAMLKKYKA